MSSTIIEGFSSFPVRNSRGEKTIEVTIYTDVASGVGVAPSGASAGKHEAPAFPKGGIEAAIRILNEEVAPELIGLDSADQYVVDELLRELDGTENFLRMGGSAAIATSIANAKAATNSLGVPLFRHLGGVSARMMPLPLGNVIGGGKHALWRSITFQEILLLPLNPESFSEALDINVRIHRKVASMLSKVDPNFAGGKNDEGAWVTRIDVEKALMVVDSAIDEALRELSKDVRVGIGIDVAASSFWIPEKGVYKYGERSLSPEEHSLFIRHIAERFDKLVYLEDPFHEEDFESFAELTGEFGDRMLVVGDDLYVTNRGRVERGVKIGAGNALIVKPNQVGTLSLAIETAKYAQLKGLIPVVSHRSGETCDETIAHLAVALGAPIIKTGIVGGERMAKLNELLRIEDWLGDQASIWRYPFK